MEGSGGDAAAPSLGLMKGVMLCNRPVPPEAVAAQRALNSSAWRTGAVAEVVHPKGRDTVLDEVLMAQQLVSSEPVETAIDKHKVWLQEVSRQRDALAKAAADQIRKADEKRRRLQESQKVFRELVRMNEGGVLGDTVPTEMLTLPPLASASAKPTAAALPSLLRAGATAASASHDAGKGKDSSAAAAAARRKPAWARSEAAQDALEEEDADRLLDFASGLDYDRFVGDLEAKAAAAAIGSRLAALRTAEAAAEQRMAELDAADAALRAAKDKKRRKLKRRKRVAAAAAADGGEDAAAGGAGPSVSIRISEGDAGAAASAGAAAGAGEGEGYAYDLTGSNGAAPARKGKKGKGLKGKGKGKRKGKGKKAAEGKGDEDEDGGAGMGHILAAIASDLGVTRGAAAEDAAGAGAAGLDSGLGLADGSGAGQPRRRKSLTAAAGAVGGGSGRPTASAAALEALRAKLEAAHLGEGGDGAEGGAGEGDRHKGRGGGGGAGGDDSGSGSGSGDEDSEGDEDEDEDGDGSSVASDESGRDTLATMTTIRTARPVHVRAGDDSKSIATSVLSSASSIRSVHSKRSLTHMIDKHMAREQARIAAAVAAGQTDDGPPAPVLPMLPPIAPPRIVQSSEFNNALTDKRGLVNLLPYQRRHPAV